MEYRTKLKVLGIFSLYYAAFSINYFAHVFNAFKDSLESRNYPLLSVENIQLMAHQDKCLDELKSPWLFVPGSFLWRKIGRPNLESPLEKKTDEKYPLIKV